MIDGVPSRGSRRVWSPPFGGLSHQPRCWSQSHHPRRQHALLTTSENSILGKLCQRTSSPRSCPQPDRSSVHRPRYVISRFASIWLSLSMSERHHIFYTLVNIHHHIVVREGSHQAPAHCFRNIVLDLYRSRALAGF